MANYWWGSSTDNRHMHWLRWDHMTQPKTVGGMGFRDLSSFNKAMLGKQGWRLMTRPESLCAKVLKGRYYPDGDFLSCTGKKRSSPTWHAIMAGREVLTKGIIRRIGNGMSTNIWSDRWLPNHFAGVPLTPGDGQNVSLVSDLLTASGQWNWTSFARLSFRWMQKQC